MQALDAIVVFVSLIFLVTELTIKDENFSTISKVLRGFFRFFRLLLVFRKLTLYSNKKTSSKYEIKTPVEKIIEIISKTKLAVDDNNLQLKLSWCTQMITTNKIYEPYLEAQQEGGDALAWIQNYSNTTKSTKEKKKIKKKQSAKPEKKGNQVLDQNQNKNTNLRSLNLMNNINIEIPEYLMEYFDHIEELNFEIFDLHKQDFKKELSYLMVHLFQVNEIFNEFQTSSQKLFNFAQKISEGYFDNPYHNKLHAFDVTQAMYFFLTTCKFIELGNLSKIDIGVCLIASACHDHEHPGLNNLYQINCKTQLAWTYNDKSPLENHHLYSSFSALKNPDCNIFEKFEKPQYKKVRESLIKMILATDISSHFQDQARLKGILGSPEFDPKVKDKQSCFEALLHAADLSNPIKSFRLSKLFAEQVLEEFWQQGDKEREMGIPISYLCDRYTTNTSKSQIGFLDFIIKPYFETMKMFLPKLDKYLPQTEENKEQWKLLIEFYDKELEKLQEQLREDEAPEKNHESGKKQANFNEQIIEQNSEEENQSEDNSQANEK